MNKAMIIGGSSGMGRELALLLARNGYMVMITGRNEPRLRQVKALFPARIKYAAFDLTDQFNDHLLEQLAENLGGVDLLILSAGGGDPNPDLDCHIEMKTIALNVDAFTRAMVWAFSRMARQGSGHIVAITSVAGLRGLREAPAYSAAKSYQMHYLAALRHKISHDNLNITITDIRPGFVDTRDRPKLPGFWVAKPSKAAKQIYYAIRKKKRVAYITRRWWAPSALLTFLPRKIIDRL